MPTILFYSSVANVSLFNTQKFYVTTIEILKEIGCDVIVSNRISDAWTKEYDAIFSFFYRKSVVPSYIAKFRGKKVFFTGGIDAMEKNIVPLKTYICQVLLFKLCRWIADWCLIESTSDMKNIKKISFNKCPKNLYYSPEAMKLSLYDATNISKENIFVSICWMESIGNVRRKGLDQSLFYFKYLKSFKQYQNAKYYILGRVGVGTDYLKDIIQELELQDDVIFTGEVSDIEKISYLKKSKYYFQLSQYEGFGVAALEAIASRCIVINSGRGGLADVIGNDGVQVDITKFDGNIESLDKSVYDKLLSFSDNDFKNIEERILKSFDWPVRVENFRKTIGKALGLSSLNKKI